MADEELYLDAPEALANSHESYDEFRRLAEAGSYVKSNDVHTLYHDSQNNDNAQDNLTHMDSHGNRKHSTRKGKDS
jgi:hypothetical protein